MTISTQYALVTLLCTQKGLQEGTLVVRVRIADTLPEDVEQEISVTQIVDIEDLAQINGPLKNNLTTKLIEQLVVNFDTNNECSFEFRDDVCPMSQHVQEERQKIFDEEFVNGQI